MSPALGTSGKWPLSSTERYVVRYLCWPCYTILGTTKIQANRGSSAQYRQCGHHIYHTRHKEVCKYLQRTRKQTNYIGYANYDWPNWSYWAQRTFRKRASLRGSWVWICFIVENPDECPARIPQQSTYSLPAWGCVGRRRFYPRGRTPRILLSTARVAAFALLLC